MVLCQQDEFSNQICQMAELDKDSLILVSVKKDSLENKQKTPLKIKKNHIHPTCHPGSNSGPQGLGLSPWHSALHALIGAAQGGKTRYFILDFSIEQRKVQEENTCELAVTLVG